MDRKKKKFDQMIWDAFSQDNNYDKLKHQLCNIRKSMYGHTAFRNLAVKDQFSLSVTIGIISCQSSRYSMNKISIFNKNTNAVFEYAPEEGFKPTETININHNSLPSANKTGK